MARSLAMDPGLAAPSQHSERGRFALVRWPLAIGVIAGAIAWLSSDVLAWSRELFLVPYVGSACILCAGFVRGERTEAALP